jgi:hypothetical protein
MIWVKHTIHIGVGKAPRIDWADVFLASMVKGKGFYNGKKNHH